MALEGVAEEYVHPTYVALKVDKDKRPLPGVEDRVRSYLERKGIKYERSPIFDVSFVCRPTPLEEAELRSMEGVWEADTFCTILLRIVNGYYLRREKRVVENPPDLGHNFKWEDYKGRPDEDQVIN